MKKIISVVLFIASFTSTFAQDCSRTVNMFVANPIDGYPIAGKATITQQGNQLSLSLNSDFSTLSGPDLHVYLSAKNLAPTVSGNTNVLIASLKSSAGSQTFSVPSGVTLSQYDYVLIHCKKFNHFWGGGLLDAPSGNCVTSTQKEHSSISISLFPNPVTDYLTFTGLDRSVVVNIKNLQGLNVMTQQVDEKVNTIHVGELPKGIYLVSFEDGVIFRTQLFAKE